MVDGEMGKHNYNIIDMNGKKIESELEEFQNHHGSQSSEPIDFTPKKFPQIIAAAAASIGSFGLGTALGWSSPAIPNLEAGGQLGILSSSDKSWIGSMVPIGATFSAWVAGYLMQRIGRKMAMILLGIPFVMGWVLMAATQNLTMMLAGRFLTGFCGGAFTLLTPMYIGEVVEDNVRGTLATGSSVCMMVGVFFSYVLGSFVSWRTMSIVEIAVPVILMACMTWMPESPRYLLEKGNIKGATKSMLWLRGATRPEEIDDELQTIDRSIQDSNAKPSGFKDLFEPCVLKPILIMCVLMMLQQFGGVNAVIFYAVDIFKSAGSDMDPNVSSMIVGVIPIFMMITSAFLVDRAGRKILLIISEIGFTIALIALGVFFYLKAQNDDKTPDGLGWLPLASLIGYTIFFNLAMAPLPWTLLGELMPPQVKGLAGALASSFCWGLAFLVTFTFADLSATIGPEGCYFLFAAISVAGILFTIVFIPETKGKSLDDIQALFQK